MAPPNESSVSFGQTAMSLGYVTDVQVRECLGIQAKMREAQRAIPDGLTTRDYVFRCVEIMFDVAAEALAERADD